MNDTPAADLTFEQALAELEQIVHDLEDGQTGLEESLARYERGVALIRRCHGQLRDAEQRILVLTGTDDEDRPVLQPFQLAPSPDGKAAGRGRKKADDSDVPF